MDATRRLLLKFGAAAGGAVLVGAVLTQRPRPSTLTLPDGSAAALDAWLRISTDGRLTVLVDRAEMGQGIQTALATLVAEELDVDLDRLRTEFVSGRPEYVNAMFHVQITAASSSVRLAWLPLRCIGAAARRLFIEAAARHAKVPASLCRTEHGEVILPEGRGRLAYSDLAPKLAFTPSGPIELKRTDQFRLIGQSLPRLDAPAKVNGSALYGIDVQVPGMLVAVIDRGPSIGARLAAFEPAAAFAVRGVRHVLRVPRGVAVVADSTWHAIEGRAALRARWTDADEAPDSGAAMHALATASRTRHGRVVRADGDPEAAERSAARIVDAEYSVPFQAHAPLEPMNATADVREDRCTIWASTQNPGGARLVAADITGLPADRILVHVTYLGGSFGRRQEIDFIAEAVDLSQRIRAPVKIVWTREDDMRDDFFRPAAVCRLRAPIDSSGAIAGWTHTIASTSIWRRVLPMYAGLRALRWMPRPARRVAEDIVGAADRLRADPNIAEGAAEMPYAIASVTVQYADVPVGIPVGAWRSVGYSYNVFALESFIDEIAAATDKDPCDLRRSLLTQAPRLRAALDVVAASVQWKARAAGPGFLGISTYVYLGTAVAMIARVVPHDGGGMRLVEIHCAVDCGIVLNPTIARAQIESAIVYGLGATTMHQSTVRKGVVVEQNFDRFRVPRIGDIPAMTIHMLNSSASPTGLGEAATPGVAPALCNAVFAATGIRIRHLPFDLQAIGTDR